jgi:ferredoxin
MSSSSASRSADQTSAPRLKVGVVPDTCCGYGVCSETCPQVFGRGDDGLVRIVEELVPADLETQAREAVAGCPQSALTIEEV